MRKITFSREEYYHIYNRGVDKRSIFEKPQDLVRFLIIMEEFNNIELTGSVRDSSKNRSSAPGERLVEFIAYCLNQNHYHFLIRPLVDQGIQKFMHRLSTGYTNYFNDTQKRSGSLFQGRYKAVHVETSEYLLHLSAYMNLNDRVHKDLNKAWMKKFPFSSFEQYEKEESKGVLCNTKIILEQFKSRKEYIKYCEKVLPQIIQRKEQEKLLKQLLVE
jgi:REP element-mobilizing transposase RayT